METIPAVLHGLGASVSVEDSEVGLVGVTQIWVQRFEAVFHIRPKTVICVLSDSEGANRCARPVDLLLTCSRSTALRRSVSGGVSGLHIAMSIQDYEVLEELTRTSRSKVRRALRNGTALQVVLKKQSHTSSREVNDVMREMVNQQRVGDPGVCEIYDCIFVNKPPNLVTILVLESLPTDLQSDMLQRQCERRPYAEEFLWRLTKTLIRVLAKAQSLNICHRDIKPANVLLDPYSVIKLSDFGCSKLIYNPGSDLHSIKGCSLYYSPELTLSRIKAMQSDGQIQQFPLNPFKCDVYSLGLTVLTAARLQEPSDLQVMTGLNEAVLRRVEALNYSPPFKQLLLKLLEVNVEQRLDFLGLQQGINEAESAGKFPFVPYCLTCGQCDKPLVWIEGHWVCGHQSST